MVSIYVFRKCGKNKSGGGAGIKLEMIIIPQLQTSILLIYIYS